MCDMKKWLLYSGLLVVNSLIICVSPGGAYTPPSPSVDSLNTLAKVDTLSFYERIKISERAYSLAEAQSYFKGQYQAALMAGMSHMGLNQFEEAISYFQTAYNLGESMGAAGSVAEARFHLGEVYYYLENFSQAKTAFANALGRFEKLDSTRWIGIIKNALGVIIYAEGDKVEGTRLYEESYQILSDNNYELAAQGPLNNLADHFFHEEKIEQAQQYFEKVLAIDRKHKSAYGESLSLLNLAWCYRWRKDYDEAISLIQESLSISEREGINQHLILAHSELSKTFKEKGDFENALFHSEKYRELHESLDKRQKDQKLADLMVQFETEITEKELEQLKAQEKIQRLTTFLLLGAACLSFIVAFLFISRIRVKRRLAESELKNQKFKSEQLQQQLNSKKQDLTNLALDISRKNSFANKIHDRLQDLVKVNDPAERKQGIKSLSRIVSNHLRLNEDAQEFQINIETVNHDFFNKLDQQFDGLTTNDKHLCGLIRLNLSSKDIAAIKNISTKSVEMGRYRLRKKLNLKPEADLSEFLQKFT